MKIRHILGGTVAGVGLALGSMTSGTASVPHDAHAQLPPVQYKMVLKTFNADGSLRHRTVQVSKNPLYGQWLCCIPDAPGGAYASISEKQSSALHLSTLWSYKEWIKWHWNIAGPGLAHRVQMVDKGWDFGHDPAWSWDGTIRHHTRYFSFYSDDSHSGYYDMHQGSFSGPALGNYDAHCYPKLYIWVNTDGEVKYDAAHGC